MPIATVEGDDEVLIRRARANDAAAFERFATRWWPRIGRFAWGMMGNAAEARVVTEEVIGLALESEQAPKIPVGRFMYRLALWLAVLKSRSRTAAALCGSPVLQALQRLDRLDRAAFLLRDVEQLSLAETAATLEAPQFDARARVHRARVSLTQVLGEVALAHDACLPRTG